MSQKHFTLIGCGAMGSALLAIALKQGVVRSSACTIVERDPHRVAALRKKYRVRVTESLRDASLGADVVLIAVKPQDARAVFDTLRGTLRSTALVISIMAGVSLRALTRGLAHDRIIRAMPNTPAQIGKGMTVWMASHATSATDCAFAQKLFDALGKALRVRDETYINAATAVSGSGPAYVFAFAEAFISAAQQLGFTKKEATLLVQQTLQGSAALLAVSADDAETLRQRVTSKKGTTEAALRILAQRQFSRAIALAISAAYRRAEELTKALDTLE